jgi:hypothetical protein
MCSWFYFLLKTTVDYVMKKHINNNCHVLNCKESIGKRVLNPESIQCE